VLFTLGVLVIYLAEGTPLHELSEQYLFTAHMVQHLLLISLAVPLMLLGTPAWLLRPALDHPLLARLLRAATKPVVALLLFNGTLAFWHLPEMYDWALWSHNAHILEHVMFFTTAVILWWPIFSPLPELPRLSYPLQILYLFVQSLVPGVIAALVTFADRVIYPTYDAAPRITHLSPLADQQMAGLIMKIVGTFMLWLLATVIFFIWANREEPERPRAAAGGEPPLDARGLPPPAERS
jgi:putative membrane protein